MSTWNQIMYNMEKIKCRNENLIYIFNIYYSNYNLTEYEIHLFLMLYIKTLQLLLSFQIFCYSLEFLPTTYPQNPQMIATIYLQIISTKLCTNQIGKKLIGFFINLVHLGVASIKNICLFDYSLFHGYIKVQRLMCYLRIKGIKEQLEVRG